MVFHFSLASHVKFNFLLQFWMFLAALTTPASAVTFNVILDAKWVRRMLTSVAAVPGIRIADESRRSGSGKRPVPGLSALIAGVRIMSEHVRRILPGSNYLIRFRVMKGAHCSSTEWFDCPQLRTVKVPFKRRTDDDFLCHVNEYAFGRNFNRNRTITRHFSVVVREKKCVQTMYLRNCTQLTPVL